MIIETIVTTQHADGSPHIAPMGIRRSDTGLISINPFRPSATLENLLRDGYAVVNYTDDVRIFAGCLTQRRTWPVIPATHIPGQRLAAALSHEELRLVKIEENPLRPALLCEIVHQETHAPFRGFNRAQAAVLEAAILASRLHMLSPEKIDAEIQYLSIAVEKTAGPAEWEAWGWLMDAIKDFQKRQNRVAT